MPTAMPTPTTTPTTTRYHVVDSAARMPASCWGRYRRVAVVETDGTAPSRIDTRAHGVVRVVETWERLHVGQTDRGAYQRARAEAVAMAGRLNASDDR